MSKNVKKTLEASSKFLLLSSLKLLTITFTVKQLHTCHVMLYIQHYIKTVHLWLKYNGLAIVRNTTKLIEGGHPGLQDYMHIQCESKNPP